MVAEDLARRNLCEVEDTIMEGPLLPTRILPTPIKIEWILVGIGSDMNLRTLRWSEGKFEEAAWRAMLDPLYYRPAEVTANGRPPLMQSGVGSGQESAIGACPLTLKWQSYLSVDASYGSCGSRELIEPCGRYR
ncbi:hypothetical protein [Paraburkholderia sp. ZP32-5]|uniref:hypothetical protein n=1 Tax=Paraburkholderia sp. ZP32-5 TaxID=2883245 RepID=UPI001F18B334|nr:hypothetical protein [Paraburkholderia sp. ZP32-5]